MSAKIYKMSEPQTTTDSNANDNQRTDSQKLLAIENELCTQLRSLTFQSPIMFVYNPLIYAKVLHEAFVMKYFDHSTKKILFVGMNPGPWGMCQTGIFFGEKDIVKDWFNIKGPVESPEHEHPKKKIKGLDCHRSETSGKKFWGFFRQLCGTPEKFFQHSFVYNFCPLAFMGSSGKNITPPEIKEKITKNQLINICNKALVSIIHEFKFEIIISIGAFAEKRVMQTLKSNELTNLKTYKIPHPSPRNAKNLSNWERETFEILKRHKLLKYFTEDPDFDGTVFGVTQNVSK